MAAHNIPTELKKLTFKIHSPKLTLAPRLYYLHPGVLQGVPFALIPICMGSCPGQVLMEMHEMETYSLRQSTNRLTDGCYQVYYLARFAVDN